MAYLQLHGPIEVNEVPPRIAEADLDHRLTLVVSDVISQIIQMGMCNAPQETPSAFILVGERVFGAAVNDKYEGADDDFSWVPTFIEAVKQGRDEVIREVVYFGVDRGKVGLNAWNYLGEAISGIVMQPVPFLPPMFNAHGHMPKKADAVESLTFVETVGKYLWGPAWELAVGEEDRC